MSDPDHPILAQPWRWEIEGLAWHSEHDSMQASLDVRFVRDGQRRTLRFIEPQDVTIQFGGKHPIQCGEMAILDISRRQLDGLTVQVTEFGASGTPLHLYARAVQEIDT
ncbi:MAG: hypothetical protein ACK6DS_05710 [Planctomycetota bacterium]